MTVKASAVAEAVKVALADAPSGTFGISFTPQRDYAPGFGQEELVDLRVTVAVATVELEAVDRGSQEQTVQVQVAVQKHLKGTGQEALDEADALTGLAEGILEYMARRPLLLCPEARWAAGNVLAFAVPEHYREKGVVTSVVSLVYLAAV